ncbi:hypothetical protein G9A89_013207 [Geosiphon pyriformis]|nr:hypothetical protein G9A89_013207 [Geosiphon pyriformis]
MEHLPDAAKQVLYYYDYWNQPLDQWSLETFQTYVGQQGVVNKDDVNNSLGKEIKALRYLFRRKHPAHLRLDWLRGELKNIKKRKQENQAKEKGKLIDSKIPIDISDSLKELKLIGRVDNINTENNRIAVEDPFISEINPPIPLPPLDMSSDLNSHDEKDREKNKEKKGKKHKLAEAIDEIIVEKSGNTENTGNSPFYKLITKMYIHLAPIYLRDPWKAVFEHFEILLCRWIPQFRGFVIAYNNLTMVDDVGIIVEDSPFVHIWVKAEMLVFRPERRQKLTGTIFSQNVDHISMRLYNFYNASIHGQYIPLDKYEWHDKPPHLVGVNEKGEYDENELDFGFWIDKETDQALKVGDKLEFEVVEVEYDEWEMYCTVVGTLGPEPDPEDLIGSEYPFSWREERIALDARRKEAEKKTEDDDRYFHEIFMNNASSDDDHPNDDQDDLRSILKERRLDIYDEEKGSYVEDDYEITLRKRKIENYDDGGQGSSKGVQMEENDRESNDEPRRIKKPFDEDEEYERESYELNEFFGENSSKGFSDPHDPIFGISKK